MQTPLRSTLGHALRAQRNHWKISQESLAGRVGFTTRYYAGIERGERNLTLDTLDEVLEILGLSLVALLAGQLIDEFPEPRDTPANANPVTRKADPASLVATSENL